MSLPDFTMNDLLPSGVHSATEAEVQERCVDPFPASVTRQSVFAGLVAYRSDISELGLNIVQWVDGSFTDRTRIDPDDIDLVNFVKASEINTLSPSDQATAQQLLDGLEQTKANYRCHTFLEVYFPIGHPFEPYFERQRKYWRRLWSTPQDYSNPTLKVPAPHRGSKGIIEMTIGDASQVPAIERRP